MNKLSYENFFINLANNTKLSIILALKEKPLNVTQISNKINVEQSAVSHSLKDLTACHVLDVKKIGKERLYSLNKTTIIPMLKLVEKHVSSNCSHGCNKNCGGCGK